MLPPLGSGCFICKRLLVIFLFEMCSCFKLLDECVSQSKLDNVFCLHKGNECEQCVAIHSVDLCLTLIVVGKRYSKNTV